MRIFDVEIYRDGGSIEFRIEREERIKHIFLKTPLAGEPRALLIDSIRMSRGAPEVDRRLCEIDEWEKSLSSDLHDTALEALARKGAFYHPSGAYVNPPPAEMRMAIEASRVMYVRDYVLANYRS